jgi:hypothetical protein
VSDHVRALTTPTAPVAAPPAKSAGQAGVAAQSTTSTALPKVPFPTTPQTPQTPAVQTVQAAKMAGLPATQAAASQQVSSSVAGPKTATTGTPSGLSQPATQPAGAGTTLAGAVEGFQQQGQTGDQGGNNGQGGSQQQQRGSQLGYSTQPAGVIPGVNPASGVQAPQQIEVSGITRIQPNAADPTPSRTVAENLNSFLSDIPYFRGKLPGNDPTGQPLRFPAQWLNGPAKPLVPPVAFAAGAVDPFMGSSVRPSSSLDAYSKRSQFLKTHKAFDVYRADKRPNVDYDALAVGQYPGATHADPAADRMRIDISNMEPLMDAQPA